MKFLLSLKNFGIKEFVKNLWYVYILINFF